MGNIWIYYWASVVVSIIIHIVFQHVSFFAVKRHIKDNKIQSIHTNYMYMFIGIFFSLQFIINFIPVINILLNGYLITEIRFFLIELKKDVDFAESLYYKEVEDK